MQKQNPKKAARPAQHQNTQPGIESKMNPLPVFFDFTYRPSGKLTGKVALVTGGDSGIGRSVAIHFASEGAMVAIIYLNESGDAKDTIKFIQTNFNSQCMSIKCDIRNEKNCIAAVKKINREFGPVNILVNNAGVHFPQDKFENITSAQIEKTFSTNVFSMFYLIKAVLPQMKDGDSIINTASVTAYRGSGHLIDYAATKGAIVSLTRSLAATLSEKGIRINAVAPGPVWTPLIPSSLSRKEVAVFGSEVPMKRAAQPMEIAPSYVFLASTDASYITGQVIHPNGGEIING